MIEGNVNGKGQNLSRFLFTLWGQDLEQFEVIYTGKRVHHQPERKKNIKEIIEKEKKKKEKQHNIQNRNVKAIDKYLKMGGGVKATLFLCFPSPILPQHIAKHCTTLIKFDSVDSLTD